MGFADDAKKKLEDAQANAEEVAEDTAENIDIAKQRVEGEIDKAQGHTIKGEAKIKTSELRDKLNN
ncbi:MAG TPA: hypothetical protein QF549_03110 [Candidatus Saccharimonadaceae bacterium]|nr:hypothetical protein [Candidatus Saccharimonadaceae bacterium]